MAPDPCKFEFRTYMAVPPWVLALMRAQAVYQGEEGAPVAAAPVAGPAVLRRHRVRPLPPDLAAGPPRKKRVPEAERRQSKLAVAMLTWPFAEPCCKKLRCSIVYKDPDIVRTVRDTYLAGNDAERRGFVSRRMLVAERGVRVKRFVLESPSFIQAGRRLAADPPTVPNGQLRVCQRFFRWITDSSTNKINQPGYRGEPGYQVELGPRRPPTDNGMRMGIIRWLGFVASYYMVDPTSSLTLLPYKDRSCVYSLMEEEHRQACHKSDMTWLELYTPTGKMPSKSWFKAVWHMDSRVGRKIRLRKWIKFTKCDECVGFRERHREATTSAQRDEIKKNEAAHHAFVRRERESYWARRDLGRDPRTRQTALSLIIDAADQGAYASPYFYERTHETQGTWRVPIHLMACISHGRRTYAYTFAENIKHGSNLTIEVLFRVLIDTLEREQKLPPVLYLQLDNTTKQCKSRYILGFLALLVHFGVFEKVVLSFLPVGHTHEDIDQIFSRLAVYLRKHNVRNQFELLEALKAAYTPRDGHEVQTGHLVTVANISDWIEPVLASTSNQAGRDGITQFHEFTFVKHNGDTVMTVREWCGDESERPKALHRYQHAHTVFEREPNLFQGVPDAQRRDCPTEEHERKLREGNAALALSKSIPPDVNAALVDVINSLCSRDPIPFHWSQRDIDMVFGCQRAQLIAAAARAEEEAERESEAGDFRKEYPPRTWVIVRPDDDDSLDWWPARVQTHPYKDEDGWWCVDVDLFSVAAENGGFKYYKTSREHGREKLYIENVCDKVRMARSDRHRDPFTAVWRPHKNDEQKVAYWVAELKRARACL